MPPGSFQMRPTRRITILLVLLYCLGVGAGSTAWCDWPQWRGTDGENHADPSVEIPSQWDLQTGQNVAWKSKIPGRGHSSPVMTDEWIFLTTADEDAQTQSLVKIRRRNGQVVQSTPLHRGTLPARIHPNNSHASPTPLIIGDHVFAAFHTDDAIYLSKVSIDGRVVWQKRIADFKPSLYQFGYGASPIRYDDLIIVAAEYDGGASGIYAVGIERGDQVYKIDRPQNLSFSTPAIATIQGRDQMVLAGAETVAAYDPANGKLLWQADAGTEAHCGTAIWDDRRVIVSGGNPAHKTWCLMADGSGRVAWDNNIVAYEQSLLRFDKYVITVANSGAVYCHKMSDGTQMWRARALGSGVSASPLLVDGKIIAADERGKVSVFRATAERFEELAEIQTGDSIFASPVADGDRLYIRAGVRDSDGRTEYLIAIGR